MGFWVGLLVPRKRSHYKWIGHTIILWNIQQPYNYTNTILGYSSTKSHNNRINYAVNSLAQKLQHRCRCAIMAIIGAASGPFSVSLIERRLSHICTLFNARDPQRHIHTIDFPPLRAFYEIAWLFGLLTAKNNNIMHVYALHKICTKQKDEVS